MTTKGEYRGVRWDRVKAVGGQTVYRILAQLGDGFDHYHPSLAALKREIDRATQTPITEETDHVSSDR